MIALAIGAVRRDDAVVLRSGFISLTAIPRYCASLRGGGPGSSPGQALTGRRAVALAAPLGRGCLGPIGIRAI